MEKFVLEAKTRDINAAKAKELREQGFIPACVYGKKTPTKHLTLPYQAFRKIYKQAGENQIISLHLGSEKLDVLIHTVDLDPVRDEYIHVDFYAITKGEKITTNIPLVLVGVSTAVKDHSGTLVQNLHEIEVRCLPQDLVPKIEVDISVLNDFGDVIHVETLNVPEHIEVLTPAELTVATVAAPHKEEEETAPATETPATEAEADKKATPEEK